MSLILVVEPDAQHAAQFASMARHHLHAELVMADSGDRAVAALAHRVPDIVLTAPLLPHHDEAVLCDYLRAFGDAAAHVQTLTIPILSAPAASQRGIRGRFKRDRTEHNLPDGCDPAIFAEQVVQYLHNARQRRSVVEAPAPLPVAPPEPAPAPMPAAMPAPAVVERAVPAAIIEEADRDFYAAVEDDDLDLTPLLTKLSDRERAEAALAARERAEAMAQPAAPVQRLEPVEPREPVQPVEPVQQPEAVEAVQRFEPVEPAIEHRAHVEPVIEQRAPVEPVIEQRANVEPVIERHEHVEPVLQRLEPIEPVRHPAPVEPVRRVERIEPVRRPEPVAPVRRVEPIEPVHQQLVRVEPVRRQPDPVERVRRREVIEPREPAQVIVEPVEKPKPRPRVAPAAPAPPAGMLVPVDRSGWLSRLQPDDRDDDPMEPVESTALTAPVEPRQVQVPQIITVPTGNGGSASVNVAVAVSVQVNAQVATVTPPPSVRRRPNKPTPVQDEWGFFDPNQCGFEALLARLDAIAAKDDDE
jgi:CheY-like chemotaxis protein